MLKVKQIKLNKQGYDSHGRYWGIGAKLYVAQDEFRPNMLDYGLYAVRANDAKEARRALLHILNPDGSK